MAKKVIFEKKNILVTGGAGFIGSHLCDELVRDSKVICIDNFLTGGEKNIDHLLSNPNFEFVKHDINKPIQLENLPGLQKFKIEFQGIQEIYHLACPMSPKFFSENIVETVLANSVGTKNILDLAIKYNAKFMHFSSSVVYGERPKTFPKVPETYIGAVNNLSERGPYDEGKRFAETMVMAYEKKYDMNNKIVRVFRVYGPRMKLKDNQIISDFVDNALDNEDIVILGDKDFDSTFCYVGDCVEGAMKVMDSNIQGPVNIGSDVLIKFSDIAKKIVDLTDSRSDILYAPADMFMTVLPVPDISKIRNELGWIPLMTIDKGLEKTVSIMSATKGVIRMENSFN